LSRWDFRVVIVGSLCDVHHPLRSTPLKLVQSTLTTLLALFPLSDLLPVCPFVWFSSRMTDPEVKSKKEKVVVDPLAGLDPLIQALKCSKVPKQREVYIELVLKLSTACSAVKASLILEKIQSIMTIRKDWTKGEKRIMYVGKILAVGALLRSRKLSVIEVTLIDTILKEIVDISLRKYSLLNVGTPFICGILNNLSPAQAEKLDLSPIQTLLNADFKNEGWCLLKIALTSQAKNLGLVYPTLDDTTALCDMVLQQVRHDDEETIKLLFAHLQSTNKMKEFWKYFSKHIGPYHYNLLHSCIGAAIGAGCSRTTLFKSEIVSPIMDVFRWDDNEAAKKAAKDFRLLLNWTSKAPTKPKHREQIIKLCFGEKFNLLSEYKNLHSVLREFLIYLTEEELNLVTKLVEESILENKRYKNSAVTFLSRLAVTKQMNLATKENIGKLLIKLGYCNNSNQGDETEEEAGTESSKTTFLKLVHDSFTTILKSVYYKDFINQMYAFVKSLA